jgi:GntR family transcriptional regulator, arabinose operon transcriptional repressor
MAERTLAIDLRDDQSGQSKHERLKDHIVNEIFAGRLKPGQAVPSVRRLVETLGVARMTVCQAMASLAQDGIIRRVQGKGTFVEADVRRKLRRGQDIFALVVPETRGGFYPSLLHGFETAAANIQHQTLICSTDDNVDRQASVVLQLLDKGVGGVALNPTGLQPTPAYQVRELQNRGIPVVFCHSRVEGVAAPLVAIPYHDVGRLAGKVLVERGHRRVAFFTINPIPTVRMYEEGLREALQAVADAAAVQPVFLGESTGKLQEEAVWASLQKVFAGPERPTAIFASFDSLAEMVYLLLLRMGLRVPEDVSLLGFGGAWREGAITKRLTSVVVNEVATGEKAVSLLHEMREGDRPIDDNSEFVIELNISDGETLAPPSDR